MKRQWKKAAIDYREYKLNKQEFIKYGFVFMAITSIAGGLLFNRFWIGTILGVLLLPVFYKKLRKYLKKKRKEKLEIEFCRYMQLASASLASGTSLDNIFSEIAETAPSDHDNQLMKNEFRIIDRLIRLNYNSTDAFFKFASRTGSRDIESMATALCSVAEKGGDLKELVQAGVNALRLKQDTEREIKQKIALPKLNCKILMFIPFGFIFLLRMMSPGYIDCLSDGSGLLVMGIVALLIGVSWMLGERVGTINI